MKVNFSSGSSYTPEELVALSGTDEMLGWSDSGPIPTLYVRTADCAVRKYIAGREVPDQLVAAGVMGIMGFEPIVLFPERDVVAVWVTATSSFRYDLLEGRLEDRYGTERQGWVYEGADHGFLTQEGIPPDIKKAVQIGSVSGIYGYFEGQEALREYRATKVAWYQLLDPVFGDEKGDFSQFAAAMWPWRATLAKATPRFSIA